MNGVDSDDLEPHKPWASRLDVAELVELARAQAARDGSSVPTQTVKGWVDGPRTSGASCRDPLA